MTNLSDLATKAAVSVATLAGLFALYTLRHAALLLLLSIAVAAAIEPAVHALVRRRMPRGYAIGLLYAVGLGFAGIGLAVAGRSLPNEIPEAVGIVQHLYQLLRNAAPDMGPLAQALSERLPDPTRFIDDAALTSLGGGALGWTARVLNAGAEIGIVLILSLLWSASTQLFERLWLSLLPAAVRARSRRFWHSLRDGVGLELRSALGQSILLCLVCGLIARALGIPCPVLVGLTMAALRLIPIVGLLLVVVVAFLCGISQGPFLAFALFIGILGVLAALRFLMAERLLSARRLNPLVVSIVLAALWEGGGFGALFIGAPVAAAISVLIAELVAPTIHLEPRTLVAHVADRVTELEALLSRSPPQRPELVNVAGRLSALVREAAIVFPLAQGGGHSP